MKADKRSSGGFTLIELMIVVAIIGILASIAAPVFMNAQLRARATERPVIARAIATAVSDVFRQTGVGALAGGFNPAVVPGTVKHPMDLGADAAWRSIRDRLTVEGNVYYQYSFTAVEAGVDSTLVVVAQGDLDGDGVLSTKTWTYERIQDTYVLVSEVPALGQEDAAGF